MTWRWTSASAAPPTRRSRRRLSGCRSRPNRSTALTAIGREIKWAVEKAGLAEHPDDPRLSGCYGTTLYDDLGDDPAGPHQRNVTVFADGEVDRSPCGSGHLGPDGAAGRGRPARGPARVFTHESIIGTRFTASVADVGTAHRRPAVVTEIDRAGLPHRGAPVHPRPRRSAGGRIPAAMTSLPTIDAATVSTLPVRRAVDCVARCTPERPGPGGRSGAFGDRRAGRTTAGDAVHRRRVRRRQAGDVAPGNPDVGAAARPGPLRAVRRTHPAAGRHPGRGGDDHPADRCRVGGSPPRCSRRYRRTAWWSSAPDRRRRATSPRSPRCCRSPRSSIVGRLRPCRRHGSVARWASRRCAGQGRVGRRGGRRRRGGLCDHQQHAVVRRRPAAPTTRW